MSLGIQSDRKDSEQVGMALSRLLAGLCHWLTDWYPDYLLQDAASQMLRPRKNTMEGLDDENKPINFFYEFMNLAFIPLCTLDAAR